MTVWENRPHLSQSGQILCEVLLLKRFLRRLTPARDEATVRLEIAAGDETQVDFGFAG